MTERAGNSAGTPAQTFAVWAGLETKPAAIFELLSGNQQDRPAVRVERARQSPPVMQHHLNRPN